MELDFKGTWRTRSGDTAVVKETENDRWYGEVLVKFNDNNDIMTSTHSCGWDENGEALTGDVGFDLMENLSLKWSSERSGGENG